jgi:hypothetical protein
MALQRGLTTEEIQSVFQKEIAAAGGTVTDTYNDGTRLFTRSVLPRVREVRQKDQVQGGVALRATEREIYIHPYVFRLVCKNGAILARATQTQQIADLDRLTREESIPMLQAAIRACCVEEAFTVATEQMRTAATVAADRLIMMARFLSRVAPADPQVATMIIKRFLDGGDRSRFGLMNAVTSVARDTRDPELRWRLEEAGGGIPVGWHPAPFLPDEAAASELPGQPDVSETVPSYSDRAPARSHAAWRAEPAESSLK